MGYAEEPCQPAVPTLSKTEKTDFAFPIRQVVKRAALGISARSVRHVYRTASFFPSARLAGRNTLHAGAVVRTTGFKIREAALCTTWRN
jgi:hypothetical protein